MSPALIHCSTGTAVTSGAYDERRGRSVTAGAAISRKHASPLGKFSTRARLRDGGRRRRVPSRERGRHDMNRIKLDDNRLLLGEGLGISFLRTLRIPDDGKTYPLPPGLGRFPVRRVDDYADRVPGEWRAHGGVFLPMYQREAMWIAFDGPYWKPRAIKVGIGKVCAITGERWSESLAARPQNYLVTPPQPWLDGIAVKKGVIRQFVAMPLGMGYTVEGQVTGEETVGGLQIKVFEPRPGRFPDEPPPGDFRYRGAFGGDLGGGAMPPPMAFSAVAAGGVRRAAAGAAMGLAAGGRRKQSIYSDRNGVDAWDPERTSRVFVHIVNSVLWREITGEEPPASPVTARDYAAHGLPWFDLYDEHVPALSGADALDAVKSVKEIDAQKSTQPLQDDGAVQVGPIKKLWSKVTGAVSDGDW